MATVNFNIVGSSSDWSGSFIVSTPSNQVKNHLPSSFNSISQNFTPNQIDYYGSTEVEYVTWRSVDISSEPGGGPNYLNVYPTQGFSLDIWSTDFYNDIIVNNFTWDSLNTKTYNLSSTKFTILYDYNTPNAIYHSKGGTISFSVT